MATKTPAKKSPSKDKKRTPSSGTSRKTIRKTTASYARRVDDDDDDDKGKKSAAGEPKADKDAASDAGKRAAKDAASDAAKDAGKDAASDQPAVATSWTGALASEGGTAAKAASDPDEPAPLTARAEPPAPAARQGSAAEEREAAEQPAAPEKRAAAPREERAQASAGASERPGAPLPPTTASEFAELLPPEAIGDWDPNSAAPPPGKAPPGDSRSFRRRHQGEEEFVLIYRHESYLITRAGKVGTQGTWTIVEYPYIGAAAHAYAQECSNFTGAGYRDLR